MRTRSRRAFLASAAALAAVGVSAAGLRLIREDDGEVAPAAPAEPTPVPASPTPRPAPRGEARFVAPVSFDFDTFDAARTGEPSTLEVLGRTCSRLLEWSDFEAPALAGDLCLGWEQPDRQAIILRLDPAARWQGVEPLIARTVTAADVVAWLERVRAVAAAGTPHLRRDHELASIARVSSPGDGLVRIDLDREDPFALQALAGPFALVQAPEAVRAFDGRWHELWPEQAAGSGPFIYRGIDDGSARFVAHANAHRPPLLEGLAVEPARARTGAFPADGVDAVTAFDPRDVAALREQPGVAGEPALQDRLFVSSVFAGAGAWQNPERRRVLSAALARHVLAGRLVAGAAWASLLVTRATPAFAPPEAMLARLEGYGVAPSDLRSRWEAAGGPELGEISVDFPSAFDPRYAASASVIELLNAALGPQFRPRVEAYTTISARAERGDYGGSGAATWFGWGPPLTGPDPSLALVELAHSGGATARTLGFASPVVDQLAEKLAAEFALERRKQLCRELALALHAEAFPVIPWILPFDWEFRVRALRRPPPGPFARQHLDREAALAS